MKNVTEIKAVISNLVPKENIIPNDTLVVYKGGYADGNFWEWNAFLKDSDGNYHNVYSTGLNGFKDSYFENDSVLNEKIAKTDCEFINVKDEIEVLYFSKKNNTNFVLNVGTLVNIIYSEKYNQMPIVFKCEDCGRQEVVGSNEIDEDYRRGFCFEVGSQNCGDNIFTGSKLICFDCYSSKICSNCGEYIPNSEDFDSNEMECIWCLDNRENDSE